MLNYMYGRNCMLNLVAFLAFPLFAMSNDMDNHCPSAFSMAFNFYDELVFISKDSFASQASKLASPICATFASATPRALIFASIESTRHMMSPIWLKCT